MRKFLLVTLLWPLLAWTADTVKPMPPVKFTDTRLENGLRVIISEDHHAPVYALVVCYGVGSKDERPGRTGLAHLVEHMVMGAPGSANVGPGERAYLLSIAGGTSSAATEVDWTSYWSHFPKNQLDLGLFLEADRMRAPTLTQEALDLQRNIVKAEMGPSGGNTSLARTSELAYDTFAYQHPTIGSVADLEAATLEDVKEFFRIYYVPNNAVLVLVGDLDTAQTLAKVSKYFGDIPRREPPKPVEWREKPRTAGRRDRIEDKQARQTRLEIAYKIPPGGAPDFCAVRTMSLILGRGETSRLNQKLVKENEVAVSVGGSAQELVGPGLFPVWITLRPGKQAEEAEKPLNDEIARLQGDGVTAEEMLRVKKYERLFAAFVRTGSVQDLARTLAADAVKFNDPGRVNTAEQRMAAVTADQVREAARKYLRPENRTVVIRVPATSPPAADPKPTAPK